MQIAWVRALLLTVCLALGACGEGGGFAIIGPGLPATGSLTLTITGLPAGVDAGVVVTGPEDYTRLVASTGSLTDLQPGTYRISSRKVLSGTAIFAPLASGQSFTVLVGTGPASVNPTINYVQQGSLTLALQQVAGGLSSPLFLTAPADDARLFIVERGGRIRVVQQGVLQTTPFLDIGNRTSTDGERGLLSMAFHPQYATNGQFFIYYTDLSGDIVIERYVVSAGNANVADPASALRIITIPHPGFSNHNGGLLSFGPDGFLYIGTGDGGGAGDPLGNAQNTGSLLGKMLRLDVNGASLTQPYAIPPFNPFVSQLGRRREIWAIGLRNPWRFAFDNTDKQLYIADVGQDRREEINVVSAGTAGANYGWNRLEGSLCFNTAVCDVQGVTLPVLEYDHGINGGNGSGGCSITGGYVYRGKAIPELQGRYFFSDFCLGGLRSMEYANGVVRDQMQWSFTTPGQILSFGQDGQNELYLLSGNGSVYRIVRQ